MWGNPTPLRKDKYLQNLLNEKSKYGHNKLRKDF